MTVAPPVLRSYWQRFRRLSGNRLVRVLVPLAVLAVVWQLADGRQAMARIMAADPAWLLLAFAALHGQTLLSALRWRWVAAALGQTIAARAAVREYYVAQIVNQTLPGGVLGDVARAARVAGPKGWRGSAMAVVIERALGQGALLAVLALGLGVSLAAGRIVWPDVLPPLVLAATVMAGVAVALMLRQPPGRQAWRSGVSMRGGGWLWPLVQSLTIVGLNLAAFAAAVRATGTALSPEAVLTLIPLILTAMLIPLSVAGWGWREGAAAALFPLAGALPEAGLAASAVYGALMLAAALPGLLWLTRPLATPPDLPA